jgi:hypothetical protein
MPAGGHLLSDNTMHDPIGRSIHGGKMFSVNPLYLPDITIGAEN